MNATLKKTTVYPQTTIKITGSKSETNRLLLLKALFPNLHVANISNSDDSEAMQNALQEKAESSDIRIVDIHHAGTAMRFLTAYFATKALSDVVLTGSQRMQERPIQILVEALQQLGVEITYEKNMGYPPIRIKGKKITANEVTLKADISSQYISALLLIAPQLENGLQLNLEGTITSMPYLKMTLALLEELGVSTHFEGNQIIVKPKAEVASQVVTVESDWSSASYWYSIIALSEMGTQVTLSSYKKNSLQGDAALAEMYQKFGVETVFNANHSITLSKIKGALDEVVRFELNNSPDIAQTIAVTCFGLGMGCDLYGLHTLKIKETDRLEALQKELSKLGAAISVTNDSLHLKVSKENPLENVKIATYQDHRMAMAFAPLALKVPIVIEEAEVVSKSYPDFWNDLRNVGFTIEEN
ncbi:3-phosphoshikimate 1-carboxyvinyltransferase [Flavobacterium sp. TP390]|uniref:3-phosphoshikimate 1-carboxyvinyltransferase n=1 Tax=Flavobacterium profundi TaxID=1774945 RepID=A0A6I4IHB8_9FLAO|nr:3-phosphoshikimate 1-carboxyvinyltransferase [Flavobacterium profundi]MVO09095.1 3-phosphoshikimate 1-carboxyvinyltransferase [Flavobacterium profundi]